MTTYKLHSQGPEVARVQARLQELGVYAGPVDGDFGGGTLVAVKAFQTANRLAIDGQVGPETWAALFSGAPMEAPAILAEPLPFRCLALTGSFETGTARPDCFAGVAGDFDGQGLSFGALQWNLGQRTLQPLLQDLVDTQPVLLQRIFDTHYGEFQAVLAEDLEEQLVWARTIQDPVQFRLHDPWRGFFKTLGRQVECQAIQVQHAQRRYDQGVDLCRTYDARSERAVALMFDIVVQNGGITEVVRMQIARSVASLDTSLPADELEVATLRIIANRRAEAARARWVEDVRARKLTIANGVGTVHGRSYDLEVQYGIRLARVNL